MATTKNDPQSTGMVHTFRGNLIPVDGMSHQHISNWIYYCTHIQEDKLNKRFFERVLEERFEGKLLMYRPHSEYEYEMEVLHNKGMIDGNTGKIFHDGKQIGQVV